MFTSWPHIVEQKMFICAECLFSRMHKRWQNSINVTFKLTLMSGLSPIHTSYLEDTTTVRQHFTCFEFTKKNKIKTRGRPRERARERESTEENKWNVSHVKAYPFGNGIKKPKLDASHMKVVLKLRITNDRRFGWTKNNVYSCEL